MIRLFDYLFCRLYVVYSRFESEAVASTSVALSTFQFLFVFNILIVTSELIDFSLVRNEVLLPVGGIILVINWLRYERNFDAKKAIDSIKNESRPKKVIRGWFIVIYLITFILLPIVFYNTFKSTTH